MKSISFILKFILAIFALLSLCLATTGCLQMSDEDSPAAWGAPADWEGQGPPGMPSQNYN